MAERFPIFTAKGDGRQIGYIEGNEAFDLLGRRRCSYNENSGNLCDDTGQIVGHVSLKGKFVGASWIADELFPKPDAASFAPPADSPGERVAPDPTKISSLSAHDPVERALAAVRIADELHSKPDATSFAAPTNSLGKPIPPDPTETSSLSDHDALERALEAVRDVVHITKTGNRYDPIGKKIVGHSLFELGASCITDEQFPKPDAASFAALTNAPSELIASDPIETSSISDHDPVERAIEAIRILDESLYAKSNATTFASANSPGEFTAADPLETSHLSDLDPGEGAVEEFGYLTSPCI